MPELHSSPEHVGTWPALGRTTCCGPYTYRDELHPPTHQPTYPSLRSCRSCLPARRGPRTWTSTPGQSPTTHPLRRCRHRCAEWRPHGRRPSSTNGGRALALRKASEDAVSSCRPGQAASHGPEFPIDATQSPENLRRPRRLHCTSIISLSLGVTKAAGGRLSCVARHRYLVSHLASRPMPHTGIMWHFHS